LTGTNCAAATCQRAAPKCGPTPSCACISSPMCPSGSACVDLGACLRCTMPPPAP
jgi:hypothetical protein